MLLRSRELVRAVASRPPKLMLTDAARILRPGIDGMAAIMPTRSKASRIILAAALGTTAVTAGTFAVPGQTSNSATVAPAAQLDLTANESLTTAGGGSGATTPAGAVKQSAAQGGNTSSAHTSAQHTTAGTRQGAATAPSAATAAGGRPVARGRVTVRGGQPGGTVAGGTKTNRARPKPRRATADDIAKLARAQIGIRENKAGGGTKFHSWYVSSRRAAQTAKRDGGKPRDYTNAAWCDMFVSWLGDRTGTSASVGSDAYTVEHAKWFQRRKRWGHQPKTGSLAFFDWSAKNTRNVGAIDHVAVVVDKNRNGTVKTVEGNISDKVVIKNRPVNSVVGFGYPDFAR